MTARKTTGGKAPRRDIIRHATAQQNNRVVTKPKKNASRNVLPNSNGVLEIASSDEMSQHEAEKPQPKVTNSEVKRNSNETIFTCSTLTNDIYIIF